VLQQGTSAQEDARQELIASVKKFDPLIKAAGARTALYMVWPLADRPKEFPDVLLSYRLAAKSDGRDPHPGRRGVAAALTKDPRLKLYSDPIHPSSFGSDLATLTIYLTLFPAGRRSSTRLRGEGREGPEIPAGAARPLLRRRHARHRLAPRDQVK
jgi:hypothetical protein